MLLKFQICTWYHGSAQYYQVVTTLVSRAKTTTTNITLTQRIASSTLVTHFYICVERCAVR
jgi:hypothetical protein